jgi:thioredoxin reductase (NADPH)
VRLRRAPRSFVGADPNTDWLHDCAVAVDEQGFIRTGFDVTRAECRAHGHAIYLPTCRTVPRWKRAYPASSPSATCGPAPQAVAAAVGEGAAVVSQIHGFRPDCLPAAPETAGWRWVLSGGR